MKFLQLSLAAGLLFSVSYSAWAGPDVYLVGNMSSWEPNESYKMTEVSEGVYTYEAASLSDSFKFASTEASSLWEGKYNLGPTKPSETNDNATVTLDSEGKATVQLVYEKGGNIKPSAEWKNVTLTLYAYETNPYVTIAPTDSEGDDDSGDNGDSYPAEIVLAGANFNNWSLTKGVAFTKNEGGVYTASVASLSGEFKIVADQSWEKSWGNAEFTASSNSKALSSGNANISIGAPYTEVQNATLTFDYNTKTLTIDGQWIQPIVETTYTLQWGESQATGTDVKFDKGDDGSYTCTFTPNIANGKFGIRAAGGKTGWYGNQNATLSESNKSVTLTANGGETSFNLTANREYTLTLDPETMELSAAWTVVDTHPADVKLTGDFNGWGFSTLMTRVGDTSAYTISGVSLSGEFKIADGSDWDNAGSKVWGKKVFSETNNSQVLEGAQGEGNNMTISSEYEKVENATLIFDYDTKELTITGTWIKPDQPDQPVGSEFESSTTIYFVNEAGWDKVYAYFYEEHPGADGKPVATTNAEWPGALLQTSKDMDVKQVTLTTESGAKLENVYAITFDASKGWERLVFNNGNGGLSSGNQTADCGLEKYGVYTNASEGEGYDTNMNYNITGPIAYSVAGYYYVSQQSAANEEFVCYYNDHAGFEGSDKWDNCWLYIFQGSEIIVKQKMELGVNQFGRTCWIVPRKAVYLSSSLQNFFLWFNNSDKDKEGDNPAYNDGKGNRMLNQTTLQNFEIYEDDVQSSYNGIMKLYVKGNVLVNGVSAQETPQLLSRNPQAGRFYAKVQPIEDGKFYLLRDPAENTTVYNNLWASKLKNDVLTVGHAAHETLEPYADADTDSSLHYTLDNSPISGEESVLVVKMRDKSIHNIKPTPEFQAEYMTEMGHSELDDVNGTGKHARVQRHGGIKINVTASNYFTDFSKCSLKFDYKPGNGGEAADVTNYVEPVYFGIHELAEKDEATTVADLESNDSEGGTTVIGTYRVFFMTPGIYTVSLTNDNGNDPIYNQETLELDETTAYATPTSIGLQVNYADVVAQTSNNADDAAKFVSNFPSYTIWFAWSDEYDSNPNIVDQLVSGADIRSGEASTENEEYDKKAEINADADVWYIRATPSNAHFSYSDELNADPSSFQIWVPSGMEGVVPSTSDSSTNALRRAVSNPEEAPAGYVKYDPYTGVNLSSSDNFNVIIDQNGVRSEAYEIAANRISDVTTGVEEIEAEEAFEEEVAPVYYNLNGLMVNGENLTPGIYVEVRGSKTRKIVVR